MINKGVKLKDIAQAKKLLRENGYFVIKISKEMETDMKDCEKCNLVSCMKCSCNICINPTHHKAHS